MYRIIVIVILVLCQWPVVDTSVSCLDRGGVFLETDNICVSQLNAFRTVTMFRD
jgi:hypothetical protein